MRGARTAGGWSSRAAALALLLLACLPVTAPFETFDLITFFHGTPSEAGSIVQAKTASDKLVSPPAPMTAPGRVSTFEPARVVAYAPLVLAHPPHDLPLRL